MPCDAREVLAAPHHVRDVAVAFRALPGLCAAQGLPHVAVELGQAPEPTHPLHRPHTHVLPTGPVRVLVER